MMLEALIRVNKDAKKDKKRGDVICVKLSEQAEWGHEERRYHQVVRWFDDALELKMREDFENTGIYPVEITPYKESENGVLKTRSKKYLNMDLIDSTLLEEILSNEITIFPEMLDDDMIKLATSEKSEEQINLEFKKNKNQEN